MKKAATPLESADVQAVDFQKATETCVLTSLHQPKAGWFANQSAANRRPAGQLDGSGDLAATVAAVRAFPAAVGSWVLQLKPKKLNYHANKTLKSESSSTGNF